MSKQSARLENWSICFYPAQDAYTPPELRQQTFQGHVHGRPDSEDGVHIITSVPTHLETEGDEVWVVTKNSVYHLGAIDPKWEELYPDAKARMLRTWARVNKP